jgi:fructose-1,6-bisphosphatase/sedoheptulose 1,7-bisphosphatase-like protein
LAALDASVGWGDRQAEDQVAATAMVAKANELPEKSVKFE